MDWLSLKTLAAKYVNRKDIDWQALQPLALDDINNSLIVQENEGTASITLSVSTLPGLSSGALPPDFAAPRAVFAGRVELNPVDIQGLMGSRSPVSQYAISGGQLWSGGTHTASVVYTRRMELMVSDTDTNPVADKYSPIWLYALAKHAAHRIQDFDARDQHQAALDLSIGQANANYAFATMSSGAAARPAYAPAGG
jgi:hypothetical protein